MCPRYSCLFSSETYFLFFLTFFILDSISSIDAHPSNSASNLPNVDTSLPVVASAKIPAPKHSLISLISEIIMPFVSESHILAIAIKKCPNG